MVCTLMIVSACAGESSPADDDASATEFTSTSDTAESGETTVGTADTGESDTGESDTGDFDPEVGEPSACGPGDDDPEEPGQGGADPTAMAPDWAYFWDEPSSIKDVTLTTDDEVFVVRGKAVSYLERFDADGAGLWCGAKLATAIDACALDGGDVAVLVGGSADGNNPADPAIVRVDAEAMGVWGHRAYEPGATTWIRGQIDCRDGKILVVASTSEGTNLVLLMNDAGEEIWREEGLFPDDPLSELTAGQLMPDGTMVIAGFATGADAISPWTRRLKLDGSVVWTVLHDDVRLSSGPWLSAAGDELAIAAMVPVDGEHEYWVASLDADGQPKWTWTEAAHFSGSVRLGWGPDGELVAVVRNPATAVDVWRFDAAGTPGHLGLISFDYETTLGALAVDDLGRVVVGGETPHPVDAWAGWIARFTLP